MAYTVNLYLTTCKLLVNGKNPENFLDRDISNIHRYINSTTCNDKKLNVNKLNEILKEQLETVLDITGNNTSQNTANVRHSNDIA
jgi:serine/threonine-protein kinase RIO1